jgi:hypothetical protein
MQRRAFRTKAFSRWMRKSGLDDTALVEAVAEMVHGLVDADLGGHLLKKRVALTGRGKRGGARVIVATRMGDRWFFVYGFQKNERSNIDSDELKALQELAQDLLGLTATQLSRAILAGEILEVTNGNGEA